MYMYITCISHIYEGMSMDLPRTLRSSWRSGEGHPLRRARHPLARGTAPVVKHCHSHNGNLFICSFTISLIESVGASSIPEDGSCPSWLWDTRRVNWSPLLQTSQQDFGTSAHLPCSTTQLPGNHSRSMSKSLRYQRLQASAKACKGWKETRLQLGFQPLFDHQSAKLLHV